MCNEVAATRLRNGRVVAHGRMKFKWKYEIVSIQWQDV
jgi:hypothetical protein